MNGAKLTGKTIKKVHQSRTIGTTGRKEWIMEAIEFTDGTVLRFLAIDPPGVKPYVLAGLYPDRPLKDDRR